MADWVPHRREGLGYQKKRKRKKKGGRGKGCWVDKNSRHSIWLICTAFPSLRTLLILTHHLHHHHNFLMTKYTCHLSLRLNVISPERFQSNYKFSSDGPIALDSFWLYIHWHVVFFVTKSCPTLLQPMDCSPTGSSIHGIF